MLTRWFVRCGYINNSLRLCKDMFGYFVLGHYVCFSELIMLTNKYPNTFSHQMEAIVFIIIQIFFATCMFLKIGEYPRYSQFYLGNIWSCDAFRPIAHEWKYLMDFISNIIVNTCFDLSLSTSCNKFTVQGVFSSQIPTNSTNRSWQNWNSFRKKWEVVILAKSWMKWMSSDVHRCLRHVNHWYTHCRSLRILKWGIFWPLCHQNWPDRDHEVTDLKAMNLSLILLLQSYELACLRLFKVICEV